MTKDPNEIVVGANGSVYVAPVGSTEPATISAALDAAFIELGYTDEDGVTFSDGKTIEDIRVWQSFYPVRKLVTERESSVSFNLMQWNKTTVPLAFGGGAVTEDAVGEYRYTPPAPETLDERAMIVEWLDGLYTYRLVIPRGTVEDAVETELVRTNAAALPITFGVTGVEGNDAWYLLTDDPELNPA